MNKVSRNERRTIFFNSNILRKKSINFHNKTILKYNQEKKIDKNILDKKNLILSNSSKNNNYIENKINFDIKFLLFIIFCIINSFFLH